MIIVGTRVRISDLTDFFLNEGIVKKIKNNIAVIKFPGKSGECEYPIDNLEEINEATVNKGKKKNT